MRYIFYSILALLVISLASCSDRRKNDDVFAEFEGERGVYMVKLPPALFLGLIGMEGDDIDKEELGEIDLVKLLVYSRENSTEDDTNHMLQRISGKMNDFEYENIFGFNSSNTFITAYILENEDYVSDLMLMLKESESLVCLGLSGKLDGKEIFKFATQIEYDKLRDFIEEK
ncbi:MAG: DUF4252 domain-containing protein [Bacteroidota bacterium]|nr:DUF4252 domain-containing protein [Bacteroidota bacterium]